MKRKKLFVTLTVILSIVLALIIFLMIWFWGDRYDGGRYTEGFNDFRSEVAIPGLSDGACPQGITTYAANYTVTETDEEGKETQTKKQQPYFLITAYFKNQPSRIYVVGQETGEVGYVTLKNVDGSDYTGHCGGIATNGYNLWVCSDRTIYVATTDNPSATNNVTTDLIKLAEEHGSLQFTTSFSANCNAAFLYFYDADGGKTSDGKYTTTFSSSDRLYVGEFYRSGKYETDGLHHVNTPNGETNRAFAYEYNVSRNKFGLVTSDGIDKNSKENVPKVQKIFSLPNEIQGFARTASGLVLSQSYGLKNSRILYYGFKWDTSELRNNSRVKYTEIEKGDTDKNKPYKNGFKYDDSVTTVNGAPFYDKDAYVYYVDRNSLLSDYSIPSMSEGLCTLDGRVYVLFESGAKKYRPFVRKVLTNVYSFIPRKSSKL